MRQKAVFLDKDGTLIEDVPYNVDPDRIRWMPGAVQGLRMLRDADYGLVVVTNQSGVARGLFSEEALGHVEKRLASMFADAGLRISGFFYCPHHPQGAISRYAVSCTCRKPAPGLLFQAAKELVLDLKCSWSVGDILDDVEAGRRAGCRTVLLNNGHETEWVLSSWRYPDLVAHDLVDAARRIIAASQGEPMPSSEREGSRGTSIPV